MRSHRPPIGQLAFVLTLVLTLALGATAVAEEALSTRVTMLVGFGGEADGGATATVVPGMVIPVDRMTQARAADLARAEGNEEAAAALVAASLQRSIGLSRVEVGYGETRELAVDAASELRGPTAGSTIRAVVTLLGFNDEIATYRVQLLQGALALADTRVAALRGGRAVVGGLDGEEAPYFFLLLEPAADRATPFNALTGDVAPPRAIVKTAPSYPEEARKNRTQGVVILQARIDRSGVVTAVEVLQGQPDGLSEAAVAAVESWQFEPALDADGKPMAVYYNLTINFRLSDGEEDAGGDQ